MTLIELCADCLSGAAGDDALATSVVAAEVRLLPAADWPTELCRLLVILDRMQAEADRWTLGGAEDRPAEERRRERSLSAIVRELRRLAGGAATELGCEGLEPVLEYYGAQQHG